MLDILQQRVARQQFLNNLRIKLLRLHKLLLDNERLVYEQQRGKISQGELLQMVIYHEQFAWLHQISQLIIEIDDLFQANEPVTQEAIATFVSQVRNLLTPNEWGNDFAMKYDAALQQNPDVVLAHADVLETLASHV